MNLSLIMATKLHCNFALYYIPFQHFSYYCALKKTAATQLLIFVQNNKLTQIY